MLKTKTTSTDGVMAHTHGCITCGFDEHGDSEQVPHYETTSLGIRSLGQLTQSDAQDQGESSGASQ